MRHCAVKIARRLIGEHHARLGYERARHRCALPLTAGELVRPMLQALAKADTLQQLAGARACGRDRRAPNKQRHRHVLERRELRQQMMKLIDEAERAIAQLTALLLIPDDEYRGRRSRTTPEVGGSRPPRICSSVVLPEPDAPTIAMRCAGATLRVTPRSTSSVSGPWRKLLQTLSARSTGSVMAQRLSRSRARRAPRRIHASRARTAKMPRRTPAAHPEPQRRQAIGS